MAQSVEELRVIIENLFAEEHFKEIFELLNDAVLAEHKDASLYAWRARSHYRLDEWDKAMKYATRAVEADSNYWMGYLARGTVFNFRKEYDKALADYNKALELKPDSATGYLNRGTTWFFKGDYDKAIADYNKTLELKPVYLGAFFNRAVTWYNKGDYDKAIEDYTRVLELNPFDGSAYNYRGVAYTYKMEYEKAIPDLEKAIELNPNDDSAYNGIAAVYYNINDYEEALRNYNRAIELNPAEAIYYRNKGETLIKLGNNEEEALVCYEKAVQLSPQDLANRRLRDELAIALGRAAEITRSHGNISLDQINESVAALNDSDKNDLLKFYYEKVYPIINNIHDLALQIDNVWSTSFGETNTSVTKWVAHYSSLLTADIFVMKDDIKMRYSNAVFMNDPEEGLVLIECLNDLEVGKNSTVKGEVWKAFHNMLKEERNHFYLGSFMPVASGHEDELLMWRTYGKDENQNEAAGCCIVMDVNFFDQHGIDDSNTISLDGDKTKKGTVKQHLCRVFYYNQRSDEFVGDNVKELKKFSKDLLKAMMNLLKKRRNGDDEYSKKYDKAVEKILYNSLSDFRYLFKSADYSYESELRVIQYSTELNGSVKLDEGVRLPRKMYVESNKPIRSYLRKIVLGPKVSHPSRWMYLEEKLKQEKIDAQIIFSQCRFQ